LDGGDGVAGGAVVPVQRPVEQSVPERCGVRVLAQDLGGFDGGDGVGDPRSTSSRLRPVSAAAWK
jgi:hypothetical protein